MANTTGNPFIGSTDLYSSSVQPDSSFEIGQLLFGKNGKAFRYGLFGELGVVGDVMQSPVDSTQFNSMAVPAAVAAGLKTVVVTNGTVAVTANQLNGGTLVVAVTPGLGEEYTIIGHSTAINGAALTLQLDRPLRTAWTTGTKVTIKRSPWSGMLKCPTTLTGIPCGVCIYPVASGEYGWVQTKGIAAVLSDNSTGAIGSDIGVPGAAAGSVGVNVAGTGKSNVVGTAMAALSSGVCIPVMLHLD